MPSSANRPENGGISFRVPEEAQGWRLDKALGLLLASPSPEQEAARPGLFALADLGLRARRRLCDRSLVLVNGKPGIPGLKLRAGQEIIILPDPEGAAIPKDAPSLVYKDGGIAALYKPAGMHTAALAGKPFPKPRNPARRSAAFGRGRLRITPAQPPGRADLRPCARILYRWRRTPLVSGRAHRQHGQAVSGPDRRPAALRFHRGPPSGYGHAEQDAGAPYRRSRSGAAYRCYPAGSPDRR